MDSITKILKVKKPLSEKDKDELLKQIISANSLITKIKAELKDYQKSAKDLMEEQAEIISQSCVKAELGYAITNVECAVRYEGNIAKNYDKATGKLIDDSSIVTDQQIAMMAKEDTDEDDPDE